MVNVRTVLAWLAATTLVLPGAPALAHNYPDAGGHNWQLKSEEKVRYFMPDHLTNGDVQRERIKSVPISSEKQRQGDASERVRENDATIVGHKVETRMGARSRQFKREGRFQNLYNYQPVDTVRVTTTTVPYRIIEITRWQERTKTISNNTYRATTQLSWVDPTNGEPKKGRFVAIEAPVAQTTYDAWVDKEQRDQVDAGQDISKLDTLLASRTDVSKIDSQLAASSTSGRSGASVDDAKNIAFGGDTSRGSRNSQTTSMDSNRRLSGSTAARATGAGQSGGAEYAALLEAAKESPDLVDDAGQAIFKLKAQGSTLLFVLYDAGGRQQAGGISLSPSAARAVDQGSQVFIDSVESEDGKVKGLRGAFRNKLLGAGGRTGHLTLK